MTVSTFAPAKTGLMDAILPTTVFSAGVHNVGLLFLGGPKSAVRRTLTQYNLNTPASGRALLPSDNVLSATLRLQINTVLDLTGARACTIRRCTRDNWTPGTGMHYVNYTTATPWTVAGGDVSATPSPVAFTGPTVAGQMDIDLTAAFVEWFLANNAGVMSMHISIDDETNNGQDRYHDAINAQSLLLIDHSDLAASPADTPGSTIASTRGEPPARGQAPQRAAATATPARAARPARRM